MNHWAHAIKATLHLAKVHTNAVTPHLWESLEYINQFQWISHNIITTYNSFSTGLENNLTYSTENSWQ